MACIALLCRSAWCPDEWREAPYETNGFHDLSTAMICMIRRGQFSEAGPGPRARRPSGGFAVGRSVISAPPFGNRRRKLTLAVDGLSRRAGCPSRPASGSLWASRTESV
jgi:hypothetical protein